MRSGLTDRLKQSGLKVTAGRVAVLGTLVEVPHADADTIYHVIAPHLATTSIQSVHNILNDLTRVGLVRRVTSAGSPALYELRVDDNHHHIICDHCGKVEDVDCVIGAAPCLEPSNGHGFQVRKAEVTFWGCCPDCVESAVDDLVQ
ncbi:MAG: transcriptional repressor [Propionibacteriaceae bacterium]|jgi:Fur family ferric uptake transcriptional regulator|nr:transcriptional repressor [Propionibacteriaceae bacterium]